MAVEILTERLERDFPEAWYEIAAPEHFWFDWRFAVLRRQIRTIGVAAGEGRRVLEIGCGHGVLRRQLEAHTAWTVDGCDTSIEALRQNGDRRGRTFLYDIRGRESDLDSAYDALFLYDVVEHIADADGFLRAAVFHLKREGFVFVNVPAVNRLFSAYDRAVGHVRRYDSSSLAELLRRHGVRLLDVRYWGFSMLPLLALRYLQRFPDDAAAADVIRKGIAPPSALADKVLRTMMRLETAALASPPLGTSVMAVGRYVGGAV